jgi:hypothetical protein
LRIAGQEGLYEITNEGCFYYRKHPSVIDGKIVWIDPITQSAQLALLSVMQDSILYVSIDVKKLKFLFDPFLRYNGSSVTISTLLDKITEQNSKYDPMLESADIIKNLTSNYISSLLHVMYWSIGAQFKTDEVGLSQASFNILTIEGEVKGGKQMLIDVGWIPSYPISYESLGLPEHELVSMVAKQVKCSPQVVMAVFRETATHLSHLAHEGARLGIRNYSVKIPCLCHFYFTSDDPDDEKERDKNKQWNIPNLHTKFTLDSTLARSLKKVWKQFQIKVKDTMFVKGVGK